MERFTGTVEQLCRIDGAELLDWVRSIPFEDWPQQRRVDEQLRPSMLAVGQEADSVVEAIMQHFPGCRDYGRLLSVVMPGHSIERHSDDKGSDWLCRIHVPLETNVDAVMVMDDGSHHMPAGAAYKVNVSPPHAVHNFGKTPRLHFMFDVMR